MAAELHIRLRARGHSDRVRCVACHEGLPGADVWRCGACRTLLHPSCREELLRCPTIGCASWAPPRIVSRPGVAPAPSPAAAADKGWGCLWLALEALFALIFFAS